MSTKKQEKQSSALSRLETQLKRGTKPDKETKLIIDLTDKDRERIQKEIDYLKTKV